MPEYRFSYRKGNSRLRLSFGLTATNNADARRRMETYLSAVSGTYVKGTLVRITGTLRAPAPPRQHHSLQA